MIEHPWNEHAVATRQGLDSMRDVIKEGLSRKVVQHIAALRLESEGLRIPKHEARQAPTSWKDQEVSSLIRSYKPGLGLQTDVGWRSTSQP